MTTTGFRACFERFANCERGATAVEYGLIASLIVVALLSAFSNFGEANDRTYNAIEEAIVVT